LSENKSIILASFIVFLCAAFSFFYIDQVLALYFHNFHHSWIIAIFNYITKLGDSLYSLVLLSILFLLYRRQKPLLSQKMLYLFATVVLSGLIVDVIKVIVSRLRPNMFFEHDMYGFVWFKMGYEFNSLPSGHSATAFALCIGLSLLFPRYKYLYILIALLVVMSRVVLTCHYLSDILLGSLFGWLTALIMYRKYFIRSLIQRPAMS